MVVFFVFNNCYVKFCCSINFKKQRLSTFRLTCIESGKVVTQSKSIYALDIEMSDRNTTFKICVIHGRLMAHKKSNIFILKPVNCPFMLSQKYKMYFLLKSGQVNFLAKLFL